VSLILAPLVAACGIRVPMVSGRSLGHTGGTLDKLESIPGFRTNLEYPEFRKNLDTVGLAMMGQTEKMCPADRKMYALRDVTATVDSIPLIAASIMSKKLAEGIDGLVLDVKTGSGAFMSRLPQARRLARTMIEIGHRVGKRVVALVTSMWQPLGETVGNSVEVVESIEALKGHWRDDLKEVTLCLGAEMLLMAERAGSHAQARRLLLRALTDGRALDKFRLMVEAQGGDRKVVDDYGRLPNAAASVDVRAESAGYIRSIDALQVGLLGVELGIGRARLDTKVDHSAGFKFKHKAGDKVARGDVLAHVLASDEAKARAAATALGRVFVMSPAPPKQGEMILARINNKH
jgi:pyrimidine-nucleoside phosphorylase